tara:strand:+ start:93 stop:1217 length:1125 start_codon:yes stop_codon:yes gene_type:complete
MNILICCEFFYPSVGGVQKVSEELAKNLSKKGNKITIATSRFKNSLKKLEYKNNLRIIRFNISGNKVRGFKGDTKEYQNFLLNTKFDVILIYAAQQWTLDLVIPIIDKIKSNLFLAPCGFSKLNNLFYKNYFKELPIVLKKFKLNILHSHKYIDSKFLKENNIRNKIVIPNGSDFVIKKDKDIEHNLNKGPITILNVSNIRFAKGQDLAIIVYFFSNIKKKSQLILYGNITGSNIYFFYLKFLKFLTEFFYSNKKVLFIKNKNRKDTFSHFINSDLFLFTSRIECSPLVLFESASAGLPFLSKDVGNSPEIAQWTGCGIVQTSIFQLVTKLDEMIQKKNLLKKMSKHGRKNAIKSYNWTSISKKYLKVFQKYNS